MPLLQSVPPESRRLIHRLCLMWGLIVSSWACLGATTPLLLKDIVGSVDAAWWQGIFTATTAVSGAITCVFLGNVSDRFGRIEMLLPWITAFFLATVCVVYAEVLSSVMLLWIARLPALAVPSTILFAFASDVVQGSAVLEAHGLLGAAFGVSLLIGSVVCGIIGRYVSRFAALCSACVLATGAALVGATTQSPAMGPPKHESLLDAARIVRKDYLLRILIVAFAIVRVGNVNSYFMFVLFTNFRLGWQTFDAAIALGIIGSLGVLWQIFGVKYIVQKHDNVVPFLLVSLGCYPVLMIGYGLATTSTAMYCVAVIGSVAGVAASIFTAKISVLAAEVGVAGTSLGLVGSLQNLIEIFSALLFGRLLSWSMDQYKPEDLLLGLPYFANALVYIAAILMVMYGHVRYGLNRPQWIGHHDERKVGSASA